VTPAFVAAHRVRHDFPELGQLRALAPLGMSGRYALCGEHKSLRIWNCKTRQIEQTLDDRRWDQAVSSPGAALLATRHHTSGLIALWDWARAAKLSEFVYDKWVGDCALSPDGRSLAIAHSPTAGNEDHLDDRVSLMDPRTRQLRLTIEGFRSPQKLVFSPDSRCLAFKSEVDVLLFDTERGKKIGTFPHQTQVLPAFHPDGALLATGGTDRRVILWDIDAEAPKAVLLGHQDQIAHLAFSHDGRTLATADETGEIRLWSVPTGRGLYVLDAASGREPEALLFTGSDDFLLDLGYGDFHLHAYESVHGH
jgi:WD40 repeat protein